MFSSIEFFFSDDEEIQEVKPICLIRKELRNRSNILELPNEIFVKNFRLSKEAFLNVLDLLNLTAGVRSTHIPPMLQLAATLNLLGSGCYQRQVGSNWTAAMAQSTVTAITTKVITQMEEKLCPLMVKFAPSEDTKIYFFEKYKIPGVVGCIDGTHVMLLRPSQNEHMFYNRKGRHSINAMIICDEKTKIMAVNAKYGGSAHDSFVWRQSNEREAMERRYNSGMRSSWLLGDSGYPLEPFLITPSRNACENSSDATFNSIHSQARSIVERCIGILKARWRILLEERKCRYAPEKVVQIINVCTALHNICCDYKVPISEHMPTNLSRYNIDNVVDQTDPKSEAIRIRNYIRDSL